MSRDVAAGRSLTVLDPGPLTTVQDHGRPGWAHLGVPRSGALDRPAADLANRLVGNDDGAALLETTLGGVTVRVSAAMAVAVTGADAPVRVDDRPAPFAEPVSVRAGATVTIGPAVHGLRSYLAVSGGLAPPPVLGSRSCDTLSGLGPDPLAAGQRIPVLCPRRPLPAVDVAVVRRASGPVALGLHPGPRADWFTDRALDALARTAYTVSTESNRIGLRLTGPALARGGRGLGAGGGPAELPSEGIVLGAVQVPASGQPLVFLNDHPTTGGYPVIALVAADDLPGCAQLRPGEQVRFRWLAGSSGPPRPRR